MENTVIRIDNLTKSYKIYNDKVDRFKEALHPLKKKYHRDFYAIKSLSLEIRKGESLGIIGFNGSGKSTLLKLICGILQPTSGAITVEGKISALLELGSSFNPELTGRENVFFTGAIYGYSKKEMEKLFPAIISFAEIGDFIDQPVKSYSSGMLVRLAFGVAINVSPQIFIIDEALSVGDIRFQKKSIEYLNNLKQRCTTIMVSHDLNTLLSLCSRIIWLHNGEIMENGDPDKVIKNYTQAVYEGIENYKKSKPRTSAQPATIDYNQTFGSQVGSIVDFRLTDEQDRKIAAVKGNDAVVLEVSVTAKCFIANPLVGFVVRNKLGFDIFGHNNSYDGHAFGPIEKGGRRVVQYRFNWPKLVPDIYSVSLALADRTDGVLTMLQFIHDAIFLESRSDSEVTGFVGLNGVTTMLTSPDGRCQIHTEMLSQSGNA
jgi:ABC-type polysaccharide/polyol phosphate transport system ATPase subunit